MALLILGHQTLGYNVNTDSENSFNKEPHTVELSKKKNLVMLFFFFRH